MAAAGTRMVGLSALFRRLTATRTSTLFPGHGRGFYRPAALWGDPVKIKMPSLSPTMMEGTIVEWHKAEGEALAPGDILCDIQTDKAVVGFEIEEEGTLAKILKPELGSTIQIGTVIAIMVEEGEDWKNIEIPAEESTGEESSGSPVSGSVDQSSSPSTHSLGLDSHGIGPAVRSLLEVYKIKADEIPSTGPHGILLKGDVMQYIKDKDLKAAPIVYEVPPAPVAKPAAAVPPPPPPSTVAPPIVPTPQQTSPPSIPSPAVTQGAQFVDVELTNMRKTIAKRLTESKTTIPHAYASVDFNLEQISKIRAGLQEEGTKVSVNDFIIKSAAVALKNVPEVNAMLTANGVQQLSAIDISVAVATDAGLITPIVKDAVNLRVEEISANVKELATRARAGKLQLHEFQGGSFTISNLGMFGITEFSAVINPPQAAIMAVGTSRLVLGTDLRPCTRMTVTLCTDARVVDETTAAQFLDNFRHAMENPILTMMEGKLLQGVNAR